MISLECLSGNWPHLAWRGEPPGFSRVAAGALDLRTGTSGTRSGGIRKGQTPCELLGGLWGFLSRRCWGLRPCVESVPEPEDSSPLLTWILGYFWSLPRGVTLRLELGNARALSSRAVAAVSRFPSRGSRDMWLSLEAFPGGIPTRLSQRAVPLATVVSVDPRLESRGSSGKTVFPGMDGDIWGTLGMVARPWSSSRLSCGERLLLRCDENTGNSVRTRGKGSLLSS